MELHVNGQQRAFVVEDGEAPNVEWLLGKLGLGERRVAVELNRRIVKRTTYAEVSVKDGDVVEIVHFVGGG